jgi:hypothetical protein
MVCMLQEVNLRLVLLLLRPWRGSAACAEPITMANLLWCFPRRRRDDQVELLLEQLLPKGLGPAH